MRLLSAVSFVLFCGVLLVGPRVAAAQNATTVGALSLSSTFECLSVRASFTGDANANNAAVIRFRAAGAGVWRDAFRPIVDRRTTISGQANSYVNQFRGSIVGLLPGTNYDVQLTISDSDGVSGGPTLSGSISTIASVPPLGGAHWYVDDLGGSGNGSSGSPFDTITAALSAASAGDTIHIRPGRYPAFSIAKSGTAAAWIALVGDDRDTTVITGGAVRNNVTINADYLQLKNLRFEQSQHNSVEIAANRHHLWLANLYHQDVSSSQSYDDAGIVTGGGNHNIYILDNTILSPTSTANPPAVPRWDSNVVGINILGTMNPQGTWVIKGNTIIGGYRDCIGNSPERFGGSTGNNTDIANNTIGSCKDDAIQIEGDDINLRIWGNDIAANNGYSVLAMESSFVGPVYVFRNIERMSWSGGGGTAHKIGGAVYTFYFHNTIDTSGAGLAHDGFAGNASTMGQVLINNIIVTSGNPLYCLGLNGGSSYDYNLYYRPAGGNVVSAWNCISGANYSTLGAFTAATGQEAHGVYGNPLFLDSAKHIGAASPAVNRGVVIANFNDQGSAWPYDAVAPDLGTYEVIADPPPSPPRNLSTQ